MNDSRLLVNKAFCSDYFLILSNFILFSFFKPSLLFFLYTIFREGKKFSRARFLFFFIFPVLVFLLFVLNFKKTVFFIIFVGWKQKQVSLIKKNESPALLFPRIMIPEFKLCLHYILISF